MTDSETSFLIDAWSFEAEQAKQLKDADTFNSDCWYHCQRDHPALSEWLQRIEIPEAVIEAMLTQDTRSTFQILGPDSFMMVIRGVNLNEGAEPDDMLSLRVLLHQGSLITLRKRPFKAIQTVRERLAQGQGADSLPQLLIDVIAALHQRIDIALDETEQVIDELEQELYTNHQLPQHTLTTMHRRLVKLNRFLQPQAAALHQAEQADLSFFNSVQQQLTNQKEAVHRITEALEALQQHVWMLREHLQQNMAEHMNRNTYWLSLIAGIFLPLGFLTGLLGVNVGGIPGTESPLAFTLLCVSLLVVGVAEFILLRRLRFW